MPKGDNAGRKTKMTKEFIEALSTVVNENILYATDEDLVDLVNEILPDDNKITLRAFRAYKNGERQEDNELYPLFVTIVKKALHAERTRLLGKLEKDSQGWQRYAWILERKFDEWNIKQKSEVKQDINIAQLPDIVIK